MQNTLPIPSQEKITKELKKDNIFKEIINEFGDKIVEILLEKLSTVKRWEIERLEKKQEETNKEHTLEMLYIAKYLIEKNNNLFTTEEKKEIYIKIALHDIGEIKSGDLTRNKMATLNEEQIRQHKEREFNDGTRLIKVLKRYGITEEKINLLLKYYDGYEKNKNSQNQKIDYFIKFIDFLQAYLFMQTHIQILDFSENEENTQEHRKNILKQLQEKNNIFIQQFEVDLLSHIVLGDNK